MLFQSVANKSVSDADSVALRHLDGLYGIPAGSINPRTNLSPTIPVFFLKQCDRGSKYALNFPADLQSRIASCLVTIRNCRNEVYSTKWTKGYNQPIVKYGSRDFINLPTYKT